MRPFLDPADGFADSYAVALLYEIAPVLDAEVVERSVRRFCPTLESIETPSSRSAAGAGRPSEARSGATRSPTLVLTARHPSDPSSPGPAFRIEPPEPIGAAALEAAVRQTWWWEEGRQVVERCRHGLLLADEEAAELPHRTRFELFQRILVGLLDAYPALAVDWRPSQQLVSPRELVETALADGFSNPLPGAVNVRFFRIEGTGRKEEMLMDTRGLVALGLPDLQCHFRGLEPNDVSRVLYTTACYLYDHGPVVENGDTVPGPGPQDRWRCRLEDSIAEPPRPVLDLDPGFPFAGGEAEEDYVLSGD